MRSPYPLYWDTSAILSTLFMDKHSTKACNWLAHSGGIHLISSLAQAEVYAVLGRMRREKSVSDVLVEAATKTFKSIPWRRIMVGPDAELLEPLSSKWKLRGADLWHLTLAVTLKSELEELRLLTFDEALRTAARGEGLS